MLDIIARKVLILRIRMSALQEAIALLAPLLSLNALQASIRIKRFKVHASHVKQDTTVKKEAPRKKTVPSEPTAQLEAPSPLYALSVL
jgi:hypothetical protein